MWQPPRVYPVIITQIKGTESSGFIIWIAVNPYSRSVGQYSLEDIIAKQPGDERVFEGPVQNIAILWAADVDQNRYEWDACAVTH